MESDTDKHTLRGKRGKHTVKVGPTHEHSTVGETVSFTADHLGTVHVNGGTSNGGWDSTYYRLPDGTFRVLLKTDALNLLLPSDMEEAIKRGQRNNFSYGRMTLEEMKAEREFRIGEGYEVVMAHHQETVRNRVRDLD
jgi:hypothetical protein